MICDLGDLDGFMQREIVGRFDLGNLNMDPGFAGQVPTTENLCMEIHRLVRSGFSQAVLERVRVEETASNSFEFAG
jgi:6-pyruvoyl-tetrahydropterin synthase